mmetsp:Transcript_4694/g.9951  ORF Transcript_4694/g.9951 Transcript_4694/m.9951 type:complete len:1291 (+) Transcript_4694:30-3902(+)
MAEVANGHDPQAEGGSVPLIPVAEAVENGAAPATPEPTIKPASMKELYRFASSADKSLMIMGGCAAAVGGAMQPAMAFFLGDLTEALYITDQSKRNEKVLTVVIELLVLALVTFLTTAGSWVCFAVSADRQQITLRRKFFAHVLRQDVGWFDVNEPATLTTRCTNDSYDFREGIGEKFSTLISGSVQTIAGFVVAFIKSWQLTLAMLIAVPLLGGSVAVIIKFVSTLGAKQQGAYAKAGGVAEQAIGSIRTVAAFGGEETEVERYDQYVRVAQQKGIRAGVFLGASTAITIMIMYWTFALGFWYGSLIIVWDINANCLDTRSISRPFGDCFSGGVMLSTLFAVLYGAFGVATLAPSLSNLAKARSAAGRMFEILDREPAIPRDGEVPAEAGDGRVEFRGVEFRYPGRPDVLALKGLSVVVEAGCTTALVGPSGSGKSTVVQLLQRFYDPEVGSVLLDGQDVKRLSVDWLRKQMGLVSQEPVLFIGSIMDNIKNGREGASEEQAIEAAKMANAHDFISSFSEGYQTPCGDRGTQLSGGQKQRVAIARAILRDPKVLLLDEATSALDSQSERVVQQALDQLLQQQRRTTIVIAHRLSTIQTADKIIVLQDGILLEQGTHTSLLGTPGSLYAQLVELQRVSADENGDDAPGPQPVGRTPTAESNRSSGRFGGHTPGSKIQASGVEENKDQENVEVNPDEVDPSEKVPYARLWVLNRKDALSFFCAILATAVVGGARPFIGSLFGDTSDLFNNVYAVVPGMKPDTHDFRIQANQKCLWFFLVGLATGSCALIQQWGFRLMAESLTRQLRLMCFGAMVHKNMGWMDARKTGDLTERLASEIPLIKAFTGESFAVVVQLIATLAVAIIYAVIASWQLTLVSFAVFPLLLVGAGMRNKFFGGKDESKAAPMVSEAVGNVRTVAAFGLEDTLLTRYTDLLVKEGEKNAKESQAMGMLSGYWGGVSFVFFAALFGFGNLFITEGWAKPGAVMNVLFPVLFAAGGVGQAQQWASDKNKARKAVISVFKTIDHVPEINSAATEGRQDVQLRGEIVFENVHFKYPTRPDIPIFEGFSVKIRAETTTAFVGPSGSGKSTVISLLQRFYDPAQGTVKVDGMDIQSLHLKWWRMQMALVQQEPVLFSGSIQDNIRYGKPSANDQEVEEAAKMCNAHDFILAFPDKYKTDCGERGLQLSGGQKQRVAIARAIVRDPKILLLDEATSALDSNSERVVQEALDRLLSLKRRTTLVIAHRLSTIRNADQICVIYQGKVVETGSHNELVKIRDGHYLRLVQRQEAAASSA